MEIPIKTLEEIEIMRASGQILAECLEELGKRALPGVSTFELDQFAEIFIREHDGVPSFKGYQGFPGTLCTNINDTVVHGIPRQDEILKEGDLFTYDCGVLYKGFHTDAARTVAIGKITPENQKLLDTAYRTLSKAIDVVRPGLHLGELSRTIQEEIETAGYHVIQDLTGHGIGRKLHEAPIILNYFDGNQGPILKPGMTLAIEPIFAVGSAEMRTLEDGWTIKTPSGGVAIQVENTVLITESGTEILTER
jgi:methionyl aminopeptidase